MLEDLGGKGALVVGGAGGLGRAVTLGLVRLGVAVAVVDRDEEAVSDLRAVAPNVAAVVGDVRDRAVLAHGVGTARSHASGIDVLVNVAGGTFHAPFLETTPRGWSALISENFTYVLEAIHAVAPLMVDNGGGSIINFTSVEGHRGAPGVAVYAAMKAALRSLTATLAVEFGTSGIRVNAVAPDVIPTPAMGRLRDTDPELRRDATYRMSVPLGRTGKLEDAANAVAFLASDASAYMTGSTLVLDGGTLAASGWFRWPGYGISNFVPEPVAKRLLIEAGEDEERF